MKKEYIQPSVKEIKFKMSYLIASSLPSSNETLTEWGAPIYNDNEPVF